MNPYDLIKKYAGDTPSRPNKYWGDNPPRSLSDSNISSSEEEEEDVKNEDEEEVEEEVDEEENAYADSVSRFNSSFKISGQKIQVGQSNLFGLSVYQYDSSFILCKVLFL